MQIRQGKGMLLGAILSSVIFITACSEEDRIAAPVDIEQPDGELIEDLSQDSLARYVTALGFRPDMIRDYGDYFIVEEDIVLSKDDLRRGMNRQSWQPSTPDAEISELVLKQYRASETVSPAKAERIRVNLSKLDANAPAWASAARQAIADWNALSCSNVPCAKIDNAWIRFVESGSAQIHIVTRGMAENIAGLAKYPFQSDGNRTPGDTIWVNPNFTVGGASARRLVVAHELGHTVGFRHTNWQDRRENEAPAGAVFIPGTVENDAQSVMNGGEAGEPWQGFSTNDREAIGGRVFRPPTVGVGGPSFIQSTGTYTWTSSVSNRGSGNFVHKWYMQTPPFATNPPLETGGTTNSVTHWIDESFNSDFGPSLRIWRTITGPAGQVEADFQSVTVNIDGCTIGC